MKEKDFSLKLYKDLVIALLDNNYEITTYEQYCLDKNKSKKYSILRHDVDRSPQSALKMAVMEKELGIKTSYYFRIVKSSNDPIIIKQIAKLGHEIGYHYEDLSNANGKYSKALKSFKRNLLYFRSFYPVKTMCMHGSPLSKWDNRILWEKHDYKKYGILGEPYFDLDFNEIFYITDASRAWNNQKVSLRDKVNSKFQVKINTVFDIIKLIESNKMPQKIMLNIHPHNWTDNRIDWLKIFLWQNIKNTLKKHISR